MKPGYYQPLFIFTAMLSICIPVYRYDVRPLVTELLRQVKLADVPVEILVYDDASPNDGDWGRTDLRQTAGIRYVELETNLGRAAIRNKMAAEASHEHLVMMDADGWPNADFVSRYRHELPATEENFREPGARVIISGGRTYALAPPIDDHYHLHWWYGTKRESRPVGLRKSAGWLGFQSNNFMVPRSLLLEFPFPTAFSGYGHEDTVWGQQFVNKNVLLYHDDNPVVHLGLETHDVFLRKQRQAMDNLRLLKEQSPHLRTRLIDLVEKIPFVSFLARLLPEQMLVNYLTGTKKPNLFALDILKLRWWK